MQTSWMLRAALVSGAALLAGCSHRSTSRTIDTTMTSDYALFESDNDQAQANEIDITIDAVQPGETYVLFFSPDAPRNTGWFGFDPTSVAMCHGDLDDHCKTDGWGYLIDVATIPTGTGSVTFHDTRTSEDVYDLDFLGSLNDHRDWTGRWAVMRIARTGVPTPVTFYVNAEPDDDDDYVNQPDAKQLQ